MEENSKIVVTEEMDDIWKQWLADASHVKTTDELVAFINHVMNDYEHDYGTVVHAVAACALAATWCANECGGGITGFQAGFVMWDYIRHTMYQTNKCGMKIVNYDDMLYPQCDYKFEKTIKPSTWEKIQDLARERIESSEKNNDIIAKSVMEHWKSIVNGEVPFGYTVVDD